MKTPEELTAASIEMVRMMGEAFAVLQHASKRLNAALACLSDEEMDQLDPLREPGITVRCATVACEKARANVAAAALELVKGTVRPPNGKRTKFVPGPHLRLLVGTPARGG